MTPDLRHPGRVRAAAGLVACLALLLASTAGARADSDCTTAFEKWSKVSGARMRMQKLQSGAETAASPLEACVPAEPVRQDLLLSLAKARAACEAAPWLDQSAKQTKEMIDANASFISSAPLCRTTEESPARVVEPSPRPLARPRACLDMEQVDAETYVLSNRKCAGRAVLAVIERRDPTGRIDCRGYTVARKTTVSAPKDSRPQINYECLLRQGNCTKEHVATIFPECSW